MGWVAAAIASAATSAIVAIIDSHLLSRKMPGLRSYLLPVGIVQLVIGAVVFWIAPLPANTGAIPLPTASGAGMSSSCGIILMLNTLHRDEVSRVIPVVNTSPIFVALLAVPLLGEALGYLEWLAIILAVADAMLISLRWDNGVRRARLSRSFVPLLLASLFFAAANIAIKAALAHISFWNMYSISAFCFGVVFISFSLRPAVLRETRGIDGLGPLLALLTGNEVIAVVAGVLSFLAIRDGPVSFAATIINTRPVFVFLFALVLSRFFPRVLSERPGKVTILTKLIAIAMVTGGVALLTLS